MSDMERQYDRDLHVKDTGEMLRATRELARHDREHQLLIEPTTFHSGPILEEGGEPTLVFPFGNAALLERALGFGIERAVFIPGVKAWKGELTEPYPPSWVKIPTNIQDLEDGWFAIPQTKDTGRLLTQSGVLVLQPSTGIMELGKRLRLLHDHPETYPVALAQRGFYLGEEQIMPPDTACTVKGRNPEQMQAVQTFAGNPVTIVWGPPGTGKSTVITDIVELSVRMGWRVLLTASTNRAIDSVGEKLLKAANADRNGSLIQAIEALRVTRYGTPSRGTKLGKISQKWRGEGVNSPRLRVPADDAVTLSTIYRCLATDMPSYDVVIVDEAGTTALPYLYAILALAATKVVVVGDHSQNSPVMPYQRVSLETRRWFESSLFHRLECRRDGTDRRLVLLPEQYRMRDRLAKNVRLTGLYPEYRTPPGDRTLTGHGAVAIGMIPLPGRECVVIDTSNLLNGFRENGNTTHTEIGEWLLHKYTKQKGLGVVGVVVPYRTQAKAYGALVTRREWKNILVGTTHTFQGSECELVIWDTVEGPPCEGAEPGKMRFVDDGRYPDASQIINVALSRAGAKLVIIAHATYLREQLSPNATLLKVLKLAQENGDWVMAEDLGLKPGGSDGVGLDLKLGASDGVHRFSSLPLLIDADHIEQQLMADLQYTMSSVDILTTAIDHEFAPRVLRSIMGKIRDEVICRVYGPKRIISGVCEAAGIAPSRIIIFPPSKWTQRGCEIVLDGCLRYAGVGGLLAGEIDAVIHRRISDSQAMALTSVR